MKGIYITTTILFIYQRQICSFPAEISKNQRFESEKLCRHQQPLVSDVPHPVKLDRVEGGGWVKWAGAGGMKIKVLFHESVDNLERDKRELIKERILPEAVQYWEEIIEVVNPVTNIRLNRKCKDNQYFLSPGETTQYCKVSCVKTMCGEYEVPLDHLEACHTCDATGRDCKKESEGGAGVSGVDFVLYVSSVVTEQCLEAVGGEAETVAYGAHCQQEEGLDRPVAGHTNICPGAIRTFERDIRSLESTIKHELLHAFGFSSSLFAFFRDSEGRPRTERLEDGKPAINLDLQVRQWSDSTIKTTMREWKVRKGMMKKMTHLVVTPRVVREVRTHFDCPTLEGAELEDQGGDGTALTHWEKRIFQNEAMTGTVNTAKPVYSRLTLALLEDSGWYYPDYSRAQALSWGRGAGCEFATQSCMVLLEQAREQGAASPFCDTLMASGPGERTQCTHDLRAVGSCNMVQYSAPLPDIYQNFEEGVEGVSGSEHASLGSSVTLADFCPFVQEFTWKGETGGDTAGNGRGTRCTNQNNAPEKDVNYALEKYGGSSRCFVQTQSWEEKSCTMLKQWSRYGSGCYEYECARGLVSVIIRNVSFPCSRAGQEIPVQLIERNTGGERWLHSGGVQCPRCEALCGDCSQQTGESQDFYEARESLGDCFREAEKDASNLLIGFLKEFGAGDFNFGRK